MIVFSKTEFKRKLFFIWNSQKSLRTARAVWRDLEIEWLFALVESINYKEFFVAFECAWTSFMGNPVCYTRLDDYKKHLCECGHNRMGKSNLLQYFYSCMSWLKLNFHFVKYGDQWSHPAICTQYTFSYEGWKIVFCKLHESGWNVRSGWVPFPYPCAMIQNGGCVWERLIMTREVDNFSEVWGTKLISRDCIVAR